MTDGRPQRQRRAAGRGRSGRPTTRAGANRSGFPRGERSSADGRSRERAHGRGDGARRDSPKGLGGDQVEGRRAVKELLSAGSRHVREIWIAQGLEPSAQLDEIEKLALRRRVKIVQVARRRLDSMARTDSAQGVLALASALESTPLDQLCAPSAGRPPFLLVLDGVSDPQNLGALLRSAECAGATGAVLPRHRAVHVTPAVAKVAAGAIEHLRLAIVAGVPTALRQLASKGVSSVGLDATADVSVFELGSELEGPIALVLGAEGKGLSQLTRNRCDTLAAIPQLGELASLNVAAAGTVACFEVARRRMQMVDR